MSPKNTKNPSIKKLVVDLGQPSRLTFIYFASTLIADILSKASGEMRKNSVDT